MSKSIDASTKAYLLQRYFAELPPRRLQRSQSTPCLNGQAVDSLENPSALVKMALDILDFQSAALNMISLFSEFITEINAFSTSPANAYRIMSSMQHSWSDWSNYLLTVELEISRMKGKYKEHALDDDWEESSQPGESTNAEEGPIDKLAFISTNMLKEMRRTLDSEDILRTSVPADSSRKLSLKKPEPKRSQMVIETSATAGVRETSTTSASVLMPDANRRESLDKVTSISSSQHSSDTIPVERFLEGKTKDTTFYKEEEGLDLISDDSLAEFSLNLSTSSEKIRKNRTRQFKRKCFVKITKKEKLLVDEAAKRRQLQAEVNDTDTESTTSTSSKSISQSAAKRKRKRIIESESSDSSRPSSPERRQTPPSSRRQRRRITSNSSDDPSDSPDLVTSNSDEASDRCSYPSSPSSSLPSYNGNDSSTDSAPKGDPLDLISDSESSPGSGSSTSTAHKAKKAAKQAKRKAKQVRGLPASEAFLAFPKFQKEKDPKAAWRKDALLTTPLDTSKDKPMQIDESSDDPDVEFVLEKRKEPAIDSGDHLSQQGRKNIKQIMSSKDLQRATLDAANAEKQRIERLKERYSQQTHSAEFAGEDCLVLDASEELTIFVDEKLTAKMKNHQRHGIQFMWDNCFESLERLRTDEGSGCILAHCMGLGKTFQVVALLHTLFKYPQTKIRTVAIICPLTTIPNWKSEFRSAAQLAKNGSDISIYCISGSNRTQSSTHSTIRIWQRTGGVLVMAYESFSGAVTKHEILKPALVDPGPDLVVCDEGHLLKSGHTHRTKTISSIRSKRRIVLTGTPMQNNLEEYYYMCSFVKPSFLGTYKEFRNRFINPITNGQYGNSDEKDIKLMKKRSHVLHKMTKGFIQRYEMNELHQYLPSMHHYVLKIDLDPLQISLYKKYIDLCKSHLKKLFANYNVLKLIWTHPRLLHQAEESLKNKAPPKKPRRVDADTDDVVFVGEAPIAPDWWKPDLPQEALTGLEFGRKFIVMMSILEQCVANGEKLLVFTSSIQALNAIEFFIKQRLPTWRLEQHYFRMDGTVPYERRKQYCSTFNQPNSRVLLFLLTHKVGGLGLNLTGANRVVIMDVSWNPTHDTQSISRIYRLGQTKPCYVYRLVAKDTMEEVMFERSVTKQAIAGRVVDELQIHRHFTAAQLCLMYRCTFDTATMRSMPKLPADHLLATLLKTYRFIFTYEDHRELMQNLPDEKLDEDEMRLAWEEYENEKVANAQGAKPDWMINATPNTTGFGVISSVVGGVDEFDYDPVASTSNAISEPNSHRTRDRFVILVEGKQNNLQLMFDENGQMVPLAAGTKQAHGITDVQLRAAQDFYANGHNNPNTLIRPGVYVIDSGGFLKDYSAGFFESSVLKTNEPQSKARNASFSDWDDDVEWVNSSPAAEDVSNPLIVLD